MNRSISRHRHCSHHFHRPESEHDSARTRSRRPTRRPRRARRRRRRGKGRRTCLSAADPLRAPGPPPALPARPPIQAWSTASDGAAGAVDAAAASFRARPARGRARRRCRARAPARAIVPRRRASDDTRFVTRPTRRVGRSAVERGLWHYRVQWWTSSGVFFALHLSFRTFVCNDTSP